MLNGTTVVAKTSVNQLTSRTQPARTDRVTSSEGQPVNRTNVNNTVIPTRPNVSARHQYPTGIDRDFSTFKELESRHAPSAALRRSGPRRIEPYQRHMVRGPRLMLIARSLGVKLGERLGPPNSGL